MRQVLDRKRLNQEKIEEKPKFIAQFLEYSRGTDVWRTLYPTKPGFTYKNDMCTSFSRLDYFILSQELSSLVTTIASETGKPREITLELALV